jgi:hypothetical protein
MATFKIPFTNINITIAIPIVDKIEQAKLIALQADQLQMRAQEDLTYKRQDTQDLLEQFGKQKLAVYDGSIRRFVELHNRVRDLPMPPSGRHQEGLHAGISFQTNPIDFTFLDGTKTIVAGGGSGAVSGFVTLGAVGAFAHASTGTAIATLHGAAAGNATLAFLGGGAVAAGGGGMAVGGMVLGGIVTIPILIIAGARLNASAKQALEVAKDNKIKAEQFVKECDDAIRRLHDIQRRSIQLSGTLSDLDWRLSPLLDELQRIIDRHARGNVMTQILRGLSNLWRAILSKVGVASDEPQKNPKVNYERFSQKEKERFLLTTSVAQTMMSIIGVGIIDECGVVTNESMDILNAAKELIPKMSLA